jgi:hypothetical protein
MLHHQRFTPSRLYIRRYKMVKNSQFYAIQIHTKHKQS